VSNYLKKAVQKLLIQKRHRLYEERIAEQAVPYGVWMEKLLTEEKAEIRKWKEEAKGGQRLSTNVLSWKVFCEAVSGGEREPEIREDLWIVTPEPSSLAEEAEAEAERYFLEHPACEIAYGDEAGYFKPGWSPDLLQSFFYFGNVFVVRRRLIEKVRERIRQEAHSGWETKEAEKVGEDGLSLFFFRKRLYDLVLYCIDEAKEAGHIEKILFLPERRFEDEDWGMEPEFEEIKKGHLYSDAEIPKEEEKQRRVSVIIPSKDNPAVLSNCIHSLREQTEYRNFEIIVVDNGSNDKNKKKILQMRHQLKEEYSFHYLYRPMAFNFSAMCNLGAKEAAGDYLLFLNDDMEIAREDWLSVMAGKAAKDYVGAVGAKLLYPDSDKIQHLGITNIHLGPAHKLQFSSDKKVYYHGINRCAVNVSAVTGACLLIRKEVFEEIGGFDERLEVAFNDVELCFHLLKAGYKNVCCNQTFLYHHESLSRGFDAGKEKVARLHRERDLLYEAYPEMWNQDSYYSRKLVTDILDRGFEPACRFEEKRMSEKAEAVRLEGEPDPVWYNECLYMGLEFTGDESAWITGRSGGGDYYIQGWSYAVNVDNSRYDKSLLLRAVQEEGGQEKNGEGLWKIPYRACYRPDFQENLPYIDHPALCGVSVRIGRDVLPKGEYLIGYLWEDACSRQKLCGFSAETLRVE
jgi:GT2 family glycosyltransferase